MILGSNYFWGAITPNLLWGADSAKRLKCFNPRKKLTRMNSEKPVSERYYIVRQRQKLPSKRGFFGLKKKIRQNPKSLFSKKESKAYYCTLKSYYNEFLTSTQELNTENIFSNNLASEIVGLFLMGCLVFQKAQDVV